MSHLPSATRGLIAYMASGHSCISSRKDGVAISRIEIGEVQLQLEIDRSCVYVSLEDVLEIRLRSEVDAKVLRIVRSCELVDDVGLPDPPAAGDDQPVLVRALLPPDELGHHLALHEQAWARAYSVFFYRTN